MNQHDPHRLPNTQDLIRFYDNPNDPDVQLTPEPALPMNTRGSIRRVAMDEILGRAAWFWQIVRKGTLGALAYTSGNTLHKFVRAAVKSGQIQPAGRLVTRSRTGLHENFYHGRKLIAGDETQSRDQLEKPDQDGLAEGARFFTSKNLLIKPHSLFAGEAASFLVNGLSRVNKDTVVVAISEEELRARGWYSPKKPSENSLYCTEVPDALLLLLGFSLRIEYQRTQKSEEYYRMKCAACYGEPVVYVVRGDGPIYDRLFELKATTKNLFVVRLRNEADLLVLRADLRKYVRQLPYAGRRVSDYYANPNFIYRAISSTKVDLFLREMARGRALLADFYNTLVPEQRKEMEADHKRKAREAWQFFYSHLEPKRLAREKRLLEARSNEAWAGVGAMMKQDAQLGGSQPS
jgi:hypothetical protein